MQFNDLYVSMELACISWETGRVETGRLLWKILLCFIWFH